MTDFLQELFAHPDFRTIARAAAFVVGGVGVGEIVRLILVLVRKWIASRTATRLDDLVIEVAERFARQIFVVLGLYIASRILDAAYMGAWSQTADGIFFVIAVLLLSLFISKLVQATLHWYLAEIAAKNDSAVDEEIVPLVRRLLNALLYSIALIICLDHFDIDIQALVVSLGVGSFAIAFAAQETLANMIAGFVIMVDRPFRVGDRIRITASQQVGDVIRIGLRSTRILDFDNNEVVIPNSEIIKHDIVNFSFPDVGTRLRIEVGVGYQTDLRAAKELLIQALGSFPAVLPDPPPQAFVVGFGDSSINMIVVGRVRDYKVLFETSDAARIAIIDAFREHGIEIPFPQRVLHQVPPHS